MTVTARCRVTKRKHDVAKRMEAHAEALMLIPGGEQWLGHTQSVVSIALSEMARWMDEIEAERERIHHRDHSCEPD